MFQQEKILFGQNVFKHNNIRQNKELEDLYLQQDIMSEDSGYIRCLGHVHRMDDTRIVNKVY